MLSFLLTVSLSADAATNLADDGGSVMPTSRFCRKQNALSRDEPILLFSHLFFFPTILLFSTYFSEYFA